MSKLVNNWSEQYFQREVIKNWVALGMLILTVAIGIIALIIVLIDSRKRK